MAKRYSKNEVGFESPAKGMDHCRDCTHFLADEHACQKVKGIINDKDWCRKFVRLTNGTHPISGGIHD